ncbi:hypothetical protein HanRHA438_Chr00c17g0851441 [Helianthus annuus]|nr:hypothetical protein HanRHA438_Chr00c17g0851441 [Helianthus annuus]
MHQISIWRRRTDLLHPSDTCQTLVDWKFQKYFVKLVGQDASRSYAKGRKPHYDLFGSGKPGDKKFREAWGKEVDDEDDCLWTGSEGESDKEKRQKTISKNKSRNLNEKRKNTRILSMPTTVMS